MKTNIFGILFVTLLLSLVSCNDEPEFDYGDFRSVFATFNDTTATGNALLTYQAHDDSNPIQMESVNKWKLDTKKNERIYMRYTVVKSEGRDKQLIRIDGARRINNDVLRKAEHEQYRELVSEPTRIVSLWRTGNYINLNSWVPYSGQRFNLMLIVDEITSTHEIVEAKLVYDLMGSQGTFERKCYASFDITNLWKRENVKTFRIHVNDPKGKKIYDFTKN